MKVTCIQNGQIVDRPTFDLSKLPRHQVEAWFDAILDGMARWEAEKAAGASSAATAASGPAPESEG